jgi:hypothetical protein
MSGKGELVEYTRLFKKAPLSERDKKELKEKINAIIDEATQTITIEALVEASVDSIKKELENKSYKKP